MAAVNRVSLGVLVVVLGAALGAIGCDAGGLLVVDKKGSDDTLVKGPPATELVSGGNVASNGKYKLFYVVGQPSPQGVSTSTDHRLNGGLTGAVNKQ